MTASPNTSSHSPNWAVRCDRSGCCRTRRAATPGGRPRVPRAGKPLGQAGIRCSMERRPGRKGVVKCRIMLMSSASAGGNTWLTEREPGTPHATTAQSTVQCGLVGTTACDSSSLTERAPAARCRRRRWPRRPDTAFYFALRPVASFLFLGASYPPDQTLSALRPGRPVRPRIGTTRPRKRASASSECAQTARGH